MFPPPAVVFTVAEKEADGVGAAVEVDPAAPVDAAEAPGDPLAVAPDDAIGEAEAVAADDSPTAGEAAEGDAAPGDSRTADDGWLDEQPATAMAARTAQAAAFLTLV